MCPPFDPILPIRIFDGVDHVGRAASIERVHRRPNRDEEPEDGHERHRHHEEPTEPALRVIPDAGEAGTYDDHGRIEPHEPTDGEPARHIDTTI